MALSPAAVALCAVAFVVTACTDDAATETPPPDGTLACRDPLALPSTDGECVRPGVPPDGCAAGFEHDGAYGCEPILPAEPCPPGSMAVPGDDACRPVMGCAAGKWGDLPVDTDTEHVDGSYTAGDGDGSAAKPWPTISEGVAAATTGALVAVAAGSYAENLLIDKQVRVWGVCPEQVEVVAAAPAVGLCAVAAVCVLTGAEGSVIGGMRLRGDGIGVLASGSRDVWLDRVHVDGNASRGIDIEGSFGSTSVVVRDSLIENSVGIGLFVGGSEARLEASLVRTTLAAGASSARGINVGPSCGAAGTDCHDSSSLVMVGSVVEQNHDIGVYVHGSSASIEASVIRANVPRASGDFGGLGIIAAACSSQASGVTCDPTVRSSAVVTQSLIEDNHGIGLAMLSADGTVERTVVRANAPNQSDQRNGWGITLQPWCVVTPTAVCDDSQSAAFIRQSFIDSHHELGISVASSSASIEATVVGNTSPRASDQLFGDGIAAFSVESVAQAIISSSLVESAGRAGMSSFGGVLSLGGSAIRCADIDLEGERNGDFDFSFEDRGANLCGCPVANEPCTMLSAGLEPPRAADVP